MDLEAAVEKYANATRHERPRQKDDYKEHIARQAKRLMACLNIKDADLNARELNTLCWLASQHPETMDDLISMIKKAQA